MIQRWNFFVKGKDGIDNLMSGWCKSSDVEELEQTADKLFEKWSRADLENAKLKQLNAEMLKVLRIIKNNAELDKDHYDKVFNVIEQAEEIMK